MLCYSLSILVSIPTIWVSRSTSSSCIVSRTSTPPLRSLPSKSVRSLNKARSYKGFEPDLTSPCSFSGSSLKSMLRVPSSKAVFIFYSVQFRDSGGFCVTLIHSCDFYSLRKSSLRLILFTYATLFVGLVGLVNLYSYCGIFTALGDPAKSCLLYSFIFSFLFSFSSYLSYRASIYMAYFLFEAF